MRADRAKRKTWASIPAKQTLQDGELCRCLEGKVVYHREVKKAMQ